MAVLKWNTGSAIALAHICMCGATGSSGLANRFGGTNEDNINGCKVGDEVENETGHQSKSSHVFPSNNKM